jgi:AraC-like DNA-binding protein
MKFRNIAEQVASYVISCSVGELSQLTRYKIANKFGINKNYLSEKFNREVQMTVLQFLELEKMKRAEKLLKCRHDMSVEKISHMLGIENLTQFRSKFKKTYGLKPGQYRKPFKTCHSGSFSLENNSHKLISRNLCVTKLKVEAKNDDTNG